MVFWLETNSYQFTSLSQALFIRKYVTAQDVTQGKREKFTFDWTKLRVRNPKRRRRPFMTGLLSLKFYRSRSLAFLGESPLSVHLNSNQRVACHDNFRA